MVEINEFDQRQLKMMVKRIGLFKNDQISKGDLLHDLIDLLNLLETKDTHWEQRFWSQLEHLEIFVICDEDDLNNDDIEIANKALEELLVLITERLSNDANVDE